MTAITAYFMLGLEIVAEQVEAPFGRYEDDLDLGVAVGGEAGIGGLIGGVAALLILPVMYGVFGFIGGLIIAVLYNLVAGMAGGIQLDLEG